MNCVEAKKLLPAMALGDLEGAERDALVGHLKDCEACRAERTHLEKTLRVAERLPAAEPSGTRRMRVVAAMVAATAEESRVAKRRPGGGWRKWGLAAAVLVAVIGGSVATARLGFATPAYELKVEDLRGEVMVLRAGGTERVRLARGETIRIGDRVDTQGGRVWFRSSVRDLVVLADASQMMINRSGIKEPSLMLVYGKLWIEATPREEGHLNVETPEGEGFVEVVGTKFQVEYR